jgi:hypothetical protein
MCAVVYCAALDPKLVQELGVLAVVARGVSRLRVGILVQPAASQRHNVVDVEPQRVDVVPADTADPVRSFKYDERVYIFNERLPFSRAATLV